MSSVSKPGFENEGELIAANEFLPFDYDVPTELVRGVLVHFERPSAVHGKVCYRLQKLLSRWAKSSQSGYVLGHGMGVVSACDPDTVRVPALGFLGHNRWPGLAGMNAWLEVAPDVVFYVATNAEPDGYYPGVIAEFLDLGTTEFWLLRPEQQLVEMHRVDGGVIMQSGEDVVSTPVLPGFSPMIAEFFG